MVGRAGQLRRVWSGEGNVAHFIDGIDRTLCGRHWQERPNGRQVEDADCATCLRILASRPDESEPVESDQPTPSSHADVGPAS